MILVGGHATEKLSPDHILVAAPPNRAAFLCVDRLNSMRRVFLECFGSPQVVRTWLAEVLDGEDWSAECVGPAETRVVGEMESGR